MTHTRAIGRQGEEMARAYLSSLGYVIRGQNIRIGRDEIDILAFDPEDQVLVFAEVKTRSRQDNNFRPEMNIDARKLHALRRATRAWVDEHQYEGGYRIDLLSVVHNTVTEHFKQLSWEDQIC